MKLSGIKQMVFIRVLRGIFTWKYAVLLYTLVAATNTSSAEVDVYLLIVFTLVIIFDAPTRKDV